MRLCQARPISAMLQMYPPLFCRRFGCLDRFLHLILPSRSCKEPSIYLACSFLTGLISGACIAAAASSSLFPTMRAATPGCVSISGLLLATLLPLLFSAFAVYIRQKWLLIPIAFSKAFLFAFLGVAFMSAFGSAGWLVRWLLMFSDILTLPLLCFFWLRAFSQERSQSLCFAVAVGVIAVFIGSLDYTVVSPFAAMLIS